MREGALKRIAIPNGKISEVGEVTYNDSDPVGYETTIKALPGSDGDTHKEYIVRASRGVQPNMRSVAPMPDDAEGLAEEELLMDKHGEIREFVPEEGETKDDTPDFTVADKEEETKAEDEENGR